MKYRDILSGRVMDNSFEPAASFGIIMVDRAKFQYLYTDGDYSHFLSFETFEQVLATDQLVYDCLKYVPEEGDEFTLVLCEGCVVDVEPLMF